MIEELAILDVAHGNTSVLLSSSQAAILDVAPRVTVLEAIDFYKLSTIDYVFISHSDFDHIGGLINLLADKNLVIKNLLINADASKNTKAWEALGIAVNDAFARYKLVVNSLNASQSPIIVGSAQINVMYPFPGDSILGAGTALTGGRRVTSNAASVVIMLNHLGHNIALFAGDMEQPTLDRMIETQCDLRADMLVFPHHGGLVGGNIRSFASSLAHQVQPKITVFSIGRNGHANPRPEIVEAVRAVVPHTSIMCTQLSKNCYPQAPSISLDWIKQLSDIPSLGIETSSSCSGSIKVELNGSNSVFHLLSEHKDFVSNNIPNALCNKN